MPGGQDWFLIVWAIVCIIVVLAMSYWVTRYVAGRGILNGAMLRRKGGHIEVLTQEMLGRDQRLVVVRVGEKYYLLGVTAGNISLLSEISWDEAAAAADHADQTHGETPSFVQAFSDALKQRTRR